MATSRERFDKIIALVVNPASFEDEAIAALKKAREMVKQDTKLAFPEPERKERKRS